MATYINSLDSIERGKLCKVKSCKVFTFGNNLKFKSGGEYRIPATIAGRRVIIKTDVVASEVPLLLLRSVMKTAQMKLNFEDDKANIFGVDVDLETTASGHCCIKLERENKNQSGETLSKENNVTFCDNQREKYASWKIDRQKKSLYSENLRKVKKTSCKKWKPSNGDGVQHGDKCIESVRRPISGTKANREGRAYSYGDGTSGDSKGGDRESICKRVLPRLWKKRGESRKTVVDAASKVFRGCTDNDNRTNLMPGQMLSENIRH